MKLSHNIFSLLLLASIFTGCNKKLDVPPSQNITPEQIQTSNDVKAVMFGAYSLFQRPNGFGERYILASDLLANTNHLRFRGTFIDYRDLPAKSQISTNAIAAGIWANSYSIINIANTVLDKLSLVNDAEREIVEGEAKFIRGVAYFQLINYFALPYSSGSPANNPGVPLITQPVYKYDSSLSQPIRASVLAIYNQILTDLNEGKDKMEETADPGRATKFAAYAFLSRVYLNMRNYMLAAQSADAVIESGKFELTPIFANAFNNTNYSSEDVFGILQTSQSNSGTSNTGMNTFYAAYSLEPPLISGRGDVQALPDYYTLNFENTDDRKFFNYQGTNIGGNAGLYTMKFQQFYKVIPVIRLAELYLTRGEANMRLGNSGSSADPVDDINTVRERSGASEITGILTADAFVNERFRELGFEGDRLWTLKRLGLKVGDLDVNNPKLILPIPQRETDVAKSLVQNPGYQ